jgi:hypothetical protein
MKSGVLTEESHHIEVHDYGIVFLGMIQNDVAAGDTVLP